MGTIRRTKHVTTAFSDPFLQVVDVPNLSLINNIFTISP